MDAINTSPRSKSESIREALVRHLGGHSYARVKFVESTNPSGNPSEDDYVVIYEATFEPADLDHAYLKIFVTEDGQVGIGFETRERLAKRLGINLRTKKKAFAAGRELASIDTDELVNFVTIVAQGKIMLHAKVGLIGLGNVKAVVKTSSVAGVGWRNPRHWDWIKVLEKELTDNSRTKLVRFDPWD